MSDEDSDRSSILFSSKLCVALRGKTREGQHQCPTNDVGAPSLKCQISDEVVQRLRHENHRLEVQDIIKQVDVQPKVPQDVALEYYISRTHNSLRSREMLQKQAKEEAQLRREPFGQTLAKDISRRHFRTAPRYDTGSKYPGDAPNIHAPEAQAPWIVLLQSRRLRAVAEAMLAHPGSLRVGPQPVHSEAPDPAQADETKGVDVPALDATLYALSLFSPARRLHAPECNSSPPAATAQPQGVVSPHIFHECGSSSVTGSRNTVLESRQGHPDSHTALSGDNDSNSANDRAPRETDDSRACRHHPPVRSDPCTAATASDLVPDPKEVLTEEARLAGKAMSGLPVGVQQRLLGDRLRELMASSRRLCERADSVLGAGAGADEGAEAWVHGNEGGDPAEVEGASPGEAEGAL